MFDNLYALSRGGHLAYAGSPQALTTHLAQCGIRCSRDDSPIEVLIKYSSNECNESLLSKLLSKTDEGIDRLRDRCAEDKNLSAKEIQFLSKRFFFDDFCVLMSRNVRQLYQYYWKYLLLKTTAILLFGYSLTLLFSPEMAKPSGCLSVDQEVGKCFQTDKAKGEALITQHIYFNFIALLLFLIFELVSTTITFTNEVKVFFNEHRNSE